METAWKVIPFFRSTSIERTVAYYTTHLSFKLGGTHSYSAVDPTPTFASLYTGPKAAVNIYFNTDSPEGRAMVAIKDVDELNKGWERLKSEGVVEVVADIEDKPWGYRQFEVQDLDGNRLTFFAFLDDGEEEETS